MPLLHLDGAHPDTLALALAATPNGTAATAAVSMAPPLPPAPPPPWLSALDVGGLRAGVGSAAAGPRLALMGPGGEGAAGAGGGGQQSRSRVIAVVDLTACRVVQELRSGTPRVCTACAWKVTAPHIARAPNPLPRTLPLWYAANHSFKLHLPDDSPLLSAPVGFPLLSPHAASCGRTTALSFLGLGPLLLSGCSASWARLWDVRTTSSSASSAAFASGCSSPVVCIPTRQGGITCMATLWPGQGALGAGPAGGGGAGAGAGGCGSLLAMRLLTGGRDGTVAEWDLRKVRGRVVGCAATKVNGKAHAWSKERVQRAAWLKDCNQQWHAVAAHIPGRRCCAYARYSVVHTTRFAFPLTDRPVLPLHCLQATCPVRLYTGHRGGITAMTLLPPDAAHPTHTPPPSSASPCDHGPLLLTASSDWTCRLWDPRDAVPHSQGTAGAPDDSSVLLGESFDGAMGGAGAPHGGSALAAAAAAGGGLVCGRPRAVFIGHGAPVTSVCVVQVGWTGREGPASGDVGGGGRGSAVWSRGTAAHQGGSVSCRSDR